MNRPHSAEEGRHGGLPLRDGATFVGAPPRGCPQETKRHRRSIRLKEYDYTQAGAYFITICVQNRECLFGEIINGQMVLNDAGRMIQTVWEELSVYYPGVDTDAFVVMPNHFHGIVLLIPETVGATPHGRPDIAGQARGPAPTLSLPDVVHRFKTLTTKRYTDGVKGQGWPPFPRRVWQRNYYERIIRDEASLDTIREYIDNNPAQWADDRENPGLTPTPVGAPPIPEGQARGCAPTQGGAFVGAPPHGCPMEEPE